MSISIQKSAAIGIAVVLAIATAVTVAAVLDTRPLVIESAQSKTIDGNPVYNQISWSPSFKGDIWTMKQSHAGRHSKEWDTIQIQIKDGAARFRQLDSAGNQTAFRAACFTCHSNGPRVIRPNLDSSEAALGLWDQTRLLIFNLRIKTYGRLQTSQENLLQSGPLQGQKTPFRYSDASLNRPLEIASCAKCHNDKWWGRGTLTKQNGNSILFMVTRGFMPPPGFALNPHDKAELKAFLTPVGFR